MVRYATKFETEEPYSIPNKGPTPKIDIEEGFLLGTFDIAWVDNSRKNVYHWSKGLKWYDRLHAHATMNSARRNAKCIRPYEPKDELDFVLEAVYCPLSDSFAEKGDPYLQHVTAFGENLDIDPANKKMLTARALATQNEPTKKRSVTKVAPSQDESTHAIEITRAYRREHKPSGNWRLLRNRITVFPDKSVPREHPIRYSMGGVERRNNIYNVKLGIAADHSPQTNPGFSRTPSGAFYSI